MMMDTFNYFSLLTSHFSLLTLKNNPRIADKAVSGMFVIAARVFTFRAHTYARGNGSSGCSGTAGTAVCQSLAYDGFRFHGSHSLDYSAVIFIPHPVSRGRAASFGRKAVVRTVMGKVC